MELSKLAEYTEQANKERERQIIATTITLLGECMKQAMREHRISEERADSVIECGIKMLEKKGE